MIDAQTRFWQIQRLVDKESVYLQDVAQRLFVPEAVTPEWIEHLIATPGGRDCLEAFVGKFSRLQDTLIDKLLPYTLAAVGEKPAVHWITLTEQTGSACSAIRINGWPCATCTIVWFMNTLKTRQTLRQPSTRLAAWPTIC